jgi:hypothetical protein
MAQFDTINLAQIYGAADDTNFRRAQMEAYNKKAMREQQAYDMEEKLKGAYAIGEDGAIDEKTTLANLYRVDPMAANKFKQGLDESSLGRQKLETEKENAKFNRIKQISGVYKDTATAIMANPTPQAAAMNLQRFSKLTGEDVSQELEQISQMTPDQIKQWAAGHALEAEKVLTKFETKDANGKLVTIGTNPLSGQVTVTNEINKTMSPAEIERNKIDKQKLGLDRQKFGLDQQKFNLDKEKASKPAPSQKTPLSASAQKELFEADETAKASENAIGMLTEALDLNKKSYSGIGAKPLAVVRSNLPGFGESDEANATINLDNLMTGQALESLKATFGGMPTEGERKILLDIQASADKTPKQREDIIKRAIKMAERRMKFNKSKADALRKGTYFTEGINEQAAPQEAGVIDFGSLK